MSKNLNDADADPDEVQYKPVTIELTAKAFNALMNYYRYPAGAVFYALQFAVECHSIWREDCETEMHEDERVEQNAE